MLGFLGRLILIVLLFLLALIVISFVLSFIATDKKTPSATPFPIPNQIAAIIELIDITAPEKYEQVLRAIRSPELSVHITDKRPEGFSDLDRMPALEWLIGQYLETLQDRMVLAIREVPPDLGVLGKLFDRIDVKSQTPVNIAIELKQGGFAILKIHKASRNRLFGLPVGFWIGVFGFLFSALALWAIAREAKPLRQLAASIEGFGLDGAPRLVARRGAPEIKRLIEAINAMQERIAALLKGRTILLGAVSHDLKTFITRLRLRTEEIPDASQRDKAATDLDDMTRIIDDAIAVARGINNTNLHDEVDLAQILRDDIANRDDTRIRLVIGPGSHIVVGDRLDLRRLFGNLLDNALRYGNNSVVEMLSNQGQQHVTIDDDGPGIPEGDRIAVFEPFFRLEQSRNRATGGSGLGLAIVKQIVEAYGGCVQIATSPIGGTRVEVILPAKQA